MPKDRVKFCAIVVSVKHVVTHQGKPIRLCLHCPRHGGERTLRQRHARRRIANFASEQARLERADVAIPDYRVCGNDLAAGGLHACGSASLDDYAFRATSKAELGAAFGGEITQPAGEAAHAAIDQPDPFALDMRDEH